MHFTLNPIINLLLSVTLRIILILKFDKIKMALSKEAVIDLLQNGDMDLEPTQEGLCFPILERLYNKMISNLSFPDIQVCDGLIINGHHRYIASILSKYEKLGRVPSIKSSAKKQFEWKSLILDEQDWDKPEEIERFIGADALYNNLTPLQLIEIIE